MVRYKLYIDNTHAMKTVKAQELCESRGGRPGLSVPNNPYGLCGRKSAVEEEVKTVRDYRTEDSEAGLQDCTLLIVWIVSRKITLFFLSMFLFVLILLCCQRVYPFSK